MFSVSTEVRLLLECINSELNYWNGVLDGFCFVFFICHVASTYPAVFPYTSIYLTHAQECTVTCLMIHTSIYSTDQLALLFSV